MILDFWGNDDEGRQSVKILQNQTRPLQPARLGSAVLCFSLKGASQVIVPDALEGVVSVKITAAEIISRV